MRTTLAIVFTAVMAITLSACGGAQQAAGDPGGAILAAAGNTTNAKTSRIDLNVNISGASGLPGPIDIKSSGVVDYQNGNSNMTADTMGIKSEVRLVDKVAYLKISDPSGAALTPKPWMKSDLNTLAGGSDVSSLQKPSDPTEGLSLLRDAGTNVTETGKEQLRGEEVTRYRLNLDLVKAVDGADPSSRAAAQELTKILGNQPLPADAWVDSDNRVRKLTYAFDLAKSGVTVPGQPAPTGVVTTSMEFYDFGVNADVTAPPAEETMELTPEMKQMLNEAA